MILAFVEFLEDDRREGVHLRDGGAKDPWRGLCGLPCGGYGFFRTGPVTDDSPEPTCDDCLRVAGWL